MAKGKAANNKQEAMATPMTRRSRKRGCSIEKKSEDNQGVSHTEDVLVECLQSPEEESEKKKSIEPLMSTILEEKTEEKNAESDLPEVTVAKQLVVCILDCGPERNQNEIDEQEIVPNEHEPLNNLKKHVEGNTVNNPDGLEQQMTAEDNLHHKIETNHDLDEVKSISIEPVVEGSAKKKRRMGMCHLSEKERNRIIPKQVNRTVRTGKQNDTRMVAEKENGSSSYPETTDIMPPLRTELLKSSPKDQKDETGVETGLNCEDAPKGGLDAGVIAKHHEETERMEMGFEMKVIALPVCESSLNICKYETKGTDLSLEKNHCTEEVQTRRISSQEIVLDLCKDYTEPYVIQTSHQEGETEHQPNKTDTGAHLTVTVCNETEAALALPHLDNEHSSRSETEVHLTTTLSDVSNSTHEQNPVHLDGSPEPNDAATLSNTKEKEKVNELQLEDVDATFTNIHKLPEEHVDVDHNPGEHSNTKTKEATEDTPTEQEDPHQQDQKDNMSLENLAHMLEIPLLIHTSVSITAPETNSTSFDASHASHSNSEENKPQETTVSMGPPQWRDVSDSQLNTIDMTVQVEADGSEVSPGGYEDVTGLVGGLIRELSSLNRAVMATHRELENLHRRGKNSRNSIR